MNIVEPTHIQTLDGDLILRRELNSLWIDDEGFFKRRYIVKLSWKDSSLDFDWLWTFNTRQKAERFRDHLIPQLFPKLPTLKTEPC